MSVLLFIRIMGGCWSTWNFMCLMSILSLFSGSSHVKLYTLISLVEFSAMTSPRPRNLGGAGGSVKLRYH